jgi:hypothetical protein
MFVECTEHKTYYNFYFQCILWMSWRCQTTLLCMLLIQKFTLAKEPANWTEVPRDRNELIFSFSCTAAFPHKLFLMLVLLLYIIIINHSNLTYNSSKIWSKCTSKHTWTHIISLLFIKYISHYSWWDFPLLQSPDWCVERMHHNVQILSVASMLNRYFLWPGLP